MDRYIFIYLRSPPEKYDSLEKEEGDNREGEDKIIRGYHLGCFSPPYNISGE